MKKEWYFGGVAAFVLMLFGAGATLAATEIKVNSVERPLIMQPIPRPVTSTPPLVSSRKDYLEKLSAVRKEYREKIQLDRKAEQQNLEKLWQEYLAKRKAMKKDLSDKETALKKELQAKESVLKEQWKSLELRKKIKI
jgi:hypothetical protein